MPRTGVTTGGNEFGEDMLQMALRMASEMDMEPVMDLEASLAPVPVNTGQSGLANSTQTPSTLRISYFSSTKMSGWITTEEYLYIKYLIVFCNCIVVLLLSCFCFQALSFDLTAKKDFRYD